MSSYAHAYSGSSQRVDIRNAVIEIEALRNLHAAHLRHRAQVAAYAATIAMSSLLCFGVLLRIGAGI